jgi:putative restriction endonuclease
MMASPHLPTTITAMPRFDAAAIRGLVGKRDANRYRWDVRTKSAAPHKPFLILAICDLYESGRIRGPDIPLDRTTYFTLAAHFTSYWSRLIRSRRGDMMLPLWALKNAGFWTLMPLPGTTPLGDRPSGFDSLCKQYGSAHLHERIFATVSDAVTREEFRNWLIAEYFDPQTGPIIQGLVTYNALSDAYGLRILEASRSGRKAASSIESYAAEHSLERPIRDQGFRVAVRQAYQYTCAACKIRVNTPDGITMVQGAHIRPHADTADDRIVNGIALCQSCHWTFDAGLWTARPDATILTSKILSWGDNAAGYLRDLSAQTLLLPDEIHLRPDPQSLAWHTKNRFRQA